MTIMLAFHPAYGLTTEEGQRIDVDRHAREWAGAEPKVTGCRIVEAHPAADHHSLWTVTVDLSFADDPQPTLWAVEVEA